MTTVWDSQGSFLDKLTVTVWISENGTNWRMNVLGFSHLGLKQNIFPFAALLLDQVLEVEKLIFYLWSISICIHNLNIWIYQPHHVHPVCLKGGLTLNSFKDFGPTMEALWGPSCWVSHHQRNQSHPLTSLRAPVNQELQRPDRCRSRDYKGVQKQKRNWFWSNPPEPTEPSFFWDDTEMFVLKHTKG